MIPSFFLKNLNFSRHNCNYCITFIIIIIIKKGREFNDMKPQIKHYKNISQERGITWQKKIKK